MLDALKLLGILALIVGLLRLRWNLGLILLLASAATGLLFGRAPGSLALDTLGAAVDPLTLRLIAIVLLITYLGEVLRSTLQMEGLIHSLSDLFKDRRWLLALMPMLIGLLPMVGGAMFSAPMVQEASQGLELSREHRTFVNYWFRHVWETVFPLYPSLILAAGLMGVTAQSLARTQWPLWVAGMIGGTAFGLAGIRQTNTPDSARPARRDTFTLLTKSIWPIALVLALSMLFDVDLIVSLVVTVVLLLVVHHIRPRQALSLARKTPLGTAPIILGAMIFRRVLETSHAVESASTALAGLGIPLPLVVFAIPMAAGLLTGLAVAAFAIGFPIVFPLCSPDLIGSGYALLAYTGGFVGLMLSPVHLCLALTRVYFKAEWGGIYRRVVPAALLLVIATVAALLLR